MSVRSLANTRGQTVTFTAVTTSTDSVGSPTVSYGSATEYKAYIADDGGATTIIQGRQSAPRSVQIYIPGNVNVSVNDRITISGVIYEITAVVHPGMKTSGPMAYTKISATSNEVAY